MRVLDAKHIIGVNGDCELLLHCQTIDETTTDLSNVVLRDSWSTSPVEKGITCCYCFLELYM